MIKQTFIYTIIFLLFTFSSLNAKISNFIVVKVGNEIISNIEIENEIKKILFFSKRDLTLKNIKEAKPVAIRYLIDNKIKKMEVDKYKIKDFSKSDLDSYILSVAKNFNTETNGLKKIFKDMNLNYDSLVDNHKTELLWNSLIYILYNKQITINESEIEKAMTAVSNKTSDKEFKLSEIEIPKTVDVDVIIGEVYNYIKKNGFKSAVKKYSSSNSVLNNGSIGWFEEKSLSDNYKKNLKNLKKGDVSNPISTENSFFILSIDDVKFKPSVKNNIDDFKKNIINQKKNEKLNLFSRSHFSNLKNRTLVSFE
jgi:parvulin-like peptidyl-prolyl isomerase